MGLKYTFFIMKISSDDLLKRLVAIGYSDMTELMLRAREFSDGVQRELDALAKKHQDKQITDEKASEEWTAMMEREPDDLVLREYKQRHDNPKIEGHGIWWMPVPGHPDWTFGDYTAMSGWAHIFDTQWDAIFITVLKRAGFDDVHRVSYHHNEDAGVLMRFYDLHGEVEIEHDKSSEDELYDFLKFCARMEKERNVPLPAIHNYILGIWGCVPWEHEVWVKDLKSVLPDEAVK